MKYVKNPPDALALMMSARSFGNYDLAGALADLIDNSIKAAAHNVKLLCLYNDGNPEIRIIDDGYGMLPDELYSAMRPASKNPLEERAIDDLGRFGWGLKSASFSQCLCLTVLSKKNEKISGAAWDLENVNGWRMGVLSEREILGLTTGISVKKQGTEVIWRKCDRLSEGGTLTHDAFNELITHARKRLALTFHRYISGEVRSKKLTIELNGVSIPRYDPFYRDHPATQVLEEETLKVSRKAKITIKPYVLPHYSKLKQLELEKLAGDEGLVRNQGFYVYRNHRLILFGTWFRLVKHGEISQLVRIGLDIPNTLDSMWKITVDKSDAQLPTALRNRIRQIVNGMKIRSTRVYRSKGGKVSDHGKVAVWKRYAKHGSISYEINRDHPLIGALYENADPAQKTKLAVALTAIEQGFPVNSFCTDIASNNESVCQSELDAHRFYDFLGATLPYLLSKNNGSLPKLVTELKSVEPYSGNWPVVEDYLISEGWINGKP